jgi:hypothetical protein
MKRMTTTFAILMLAACLKAPPMQGHEGLSLSWWENYTAEKKREQRIDNILHALRTIESGGDYTAKGRSGEYGAYQWMPESFAQFSYRYFGELLDITLPENQDKVARMKVEELIDAGLSEKDIAATWNSGSHLGWENKRGRNRFGVRYDVPKYVNKFIEVLNQIETT